jgi:hypothetical protein
VDLYREQCSRDKGSQDAGNLWASDYELRISSLDVSRGVMSGENLTSLKSGSRLRRDGDSFVYHFGQMTGFPPDEGAQIRLAVEAATGGPILGRSP